MSALAPALGALSEKPPTRSQALRRLARSVPATALVFGLLGPLLEGLISWTLLVLIPTLAATQDVSSIFSIITATLLPAIGKAYMLVAVPLTLTGALVAVLSPYAPMREQFIAGIAPVGAFCLYLAATWLRASDPTIPSPLFMALLGAGTAILCAMAATSWPLGRPGRESRAKRRDRLARQRAERLKAARAAAP